MKNSDNLDSSDSDSSKNEDGEKSTADFVKTLISLSEGQRLAFILIEANIRLVCMLIEEGLTRCCDNYD